jgi:predicted amidohydrolase YtcJ
MWLIFAIFSADWPIVSPVDGSAIAGVIGTRSFGRIFASDCTRAPKLFARDAATISPARFLHATDSLGTIERGKVADLVLLDADPLDDIGNVARVRAVVAAGRLFDRAALDALLAEVRRAIH